MRALIAGALWAAVSVPLALVIARIIRAAGASSIADEAERWLRSRSITRRERWTAIVARSILAVVLLAPLAAAGAVAAWRLPSLMTASRTDGQVARAWPSGQQDPRATTWARTRAEEEPVEPEPVVAPTADAAERTDAADEGEARQSAPARSRGTPMAAAAASDGADDEPPPTTTTTAPARCDEGTTSTTTPPETGQEPTAERSCPEDEPAESAPDGSTVPDDADPPSSVPGR